MADKSIKNDGGNIPPRLRSFRSIIFLKQKNQLGGLDDANVATRKLEPPIM